MRFHTLIAAGFVCTVIAWSAPAFAAETGASPPQPVAAAPKGPNWLLRVPQEPNVAYQGVVSYDHAGIGTAGMLYPAPNLAGFFAALITHGVLLESSRNEQLESIRKAANQVLTPYQPILSSFQHRDLMQRGLDKTTVEGPKRLVDFSDTQVSDLLVESVPLFSMTQDQSAIIMDNAVTIYRPSAQGKPAYKNILRIVSRPQSRTDLVSYWTANDGENLKAESAALLAESIELAFQEMVTPPGKNANPHRTVRYLEGTTERMERGEIVSERCDRVVMKNLRGWLMSVPSRTSTDAAGKCGTDTKQSAGNTQ